MGSTLRRAWIPIWLRKFPEIFTDEQANAEISKYMAERIRGRVDDRGRRETYSEYGFGVQRVPRKPVISKRLIATMFI